MYLSLSLSLSLHIYIYIYIYIALRIRARGLADCASVRPPARSACVADDEFKPDEAKWQVRSLLFSTSDAPETA